MAFYYGNAGQYQQLTNAQLANAQTNARIYCTWVTQTASTTDTAWFDWIAQSTATTISNYAPGAGQGGNWQQDRQQQINAENAASEREYRERMQREMAQAQAKQLEAEERADALLIAYLDAEQRAELKAHRQFMVCAKSGTKYRIRRGLTVEELDGKGGVRRRLCCLPLGVPLPDVMLTQLFMLRHHEADFIRSANVH